MSPSRATAFLGTFALAACSQGPAPQDRPAEAAAASAAGERFLDRESFTIEYAVSGDASGTIVEHVRDWGKRRAEVQDTTATILGTSTVQQTRKVQDGATLYTFDLASGTMTSGPAPFYQEFVDASRGTTGVETGKAILRALGGTETGETGAFAGEPCVYWEIARLGSRTCVTEWGGTLHASTRIGRLTLERTATNVRIGDGGPNEAFSTVTP